MAGMGPAPNPNRRRRNPTVPMVPLPAGGYRGEVPEWPLGVDIATQAKLELAESKVALLEAKLEAGEKVAGALDRAMERVLYLRKVIDVQADRELPLWRDLWRTPQAEAWSRLSYTREVAQYARWKVLAECGELDAAKEARQLGDRLGMTPLALLRLRWEIVDDVASAPGRTPAGGPVTPISSAPSRRQRMG